MKSKLVKSLTLVAFFLVAVPLFNQAKAANQVFLTISPPINELILEPGSKSTHGLSILNQADEPVTVDVRVSPFVPEGDDGQVNISDEALPNSQDWVTVYPNRFKLQPKESKVLSYTIELPDNASPGGFYFAIVASSSPSKYTSSGTDVETGSAVVASVSELVLVRVNGPVSYNARIDSFDTADGRRFFSYGPVDFVAKIRNLSNVHAVFSNEIVVENVLFPKKYVLTMSSQRILPQATRKFTAQLPNKWHFGYYKASLTTNYAGGNNLQSVIMFWIMPVKEIVLGLSVFILVILLVIILVRRSHRKHEEIEQLQEAVEKLEKIEEQIKK